VAGLQARHRSANEKTRDRHLRPRA
jgi:hypothetical protein